LKITNTSADLLARGPCAFLVKGVSKTDLIQIPSCAALRLLALAMLIGLITWGLNEIRINENITVNLLSAPTLDRAGIEIRNWLVYSWEGG
jgi:hypothetical protein